MTIKTLNVFLTSFPGLGLPSTLSIPMVSSSPISQVYSQIDSRLPQTKTRYIITTTSNKEVSSRSTGPISSLLTSDDDCFITLRVSLPLCGGKGGFGSQLRAAGGRMSSKRKKNQGENNGSSRNLDGRRLRTVTEAKALAEYLAVKPEMEKKEKETRRKRWEQVVELAEKREEELKHETKGRVNGKWVEDKEEATDRTREAVLAAMKSGDYKDTMFSKSVDNTGNSSNSVEARSRSSSIVESEGNPRLASKNLAKQAAKPAQAFYGFDDDDEFMSSDSGTRAD